MGNFKLSRDWMRFVRYYQAGLINTAFGFGTYSVFIWLGFGIFLAQILSHFLGVAFNYLTYSRYAFSDRSASRVKFIMSYVFNYVLSFGVIWLFSLFFASPYLAGFSTVLVVSLANYFVLKRFVFFGEGKVVA